ncbi:N-acetylneuraminate synthase family protein [Bacillus sp. Bva_UNVM-123]|uniref:N-acetylneuraminate synthase family protein n=1 Tax=Bacillus sp. Bva_UNVM-123 TaxID=2829798 RepID=UPI00391F1762
MRFIFEDIKNFSKPYIIAEIGANHNGDLNLAKKLIDQAVSAGANCAKFQSWTKDSVFSKKVYEDNYFLGDDYRNRNDYTLEEIVEEFSFDKDDFKKLKQYCDEKNIDFGCTPFSKEEANFLVDELKIPFIKVASMDLNNYPFLEYLAAKEVPIVLATGLSEISEIDEAIRCIEKYHNKIVLLHCVSNYPPRDEDVNLRNITMLQDYYKPYSVGFSDHTIGVEIPLASVALGASIIEKHFTLDKEMFGWDHKVSADYNDLVQIVEGSQRISEALGSYRRHLTKYDEEKIPAFRRSIVAAKDILKDKIIEIDDLDFKRPGTGIEPKYINFIVGKKAKRHIVYDQLLTHEDF